MKLLTIAIPSIISRSKEFNILYAFIHNQITDNNLQDEVELIYEIDNKEISIGAKRQILIERATGKFLVMIDDDDWIHDNYVRLVVSAIIDNPGIDCIGYREKCIIINRHERSCISLRFKEWSDNKHGFDHVRTPFFKTPILTDHCKMIGCEDMRFGEDHDFANRIYPLLKNEYFIDKSMYIYRYKAENHNVKYGIK